MPSPTRDLDRRSGGGASRRTCRPAGPRGTQDGHLGYPVTPMLAPMLARAVDAADFSTIEKRRRERAGFGLVPWVSGHAELLNAVGKHARHVMFSTLEAGSSRVSSKCERDMCASSTGMLRTPGTADCGVSSVCARARLCSCICQFVHVRACVRALFREGTGHTAWANESGCLADREWARTVAAGTQVGIMSNSWRLVGGFWENVHRRRDARSRFQDV